jgi:rhodanese-related sulfurtransferase
MRILLLSLMLCLVTVLCHGQSGSSGSVDGTASGDAYDMPPAQLVKLLGSAHLFIFDCNEADMYAEAHVPGAKLIVYDEVTADKLPVDKDATLVFYCYSDQCPASHAAANTARGLGYTNVYYMLAGITGWQDAGLPTEP